MTDRLAAVVVIANGVLASLYLWRAQPSWAIPAERAASISTITGEPFIWALGVFPVVIIALLLNLGVRATFRRRSSVTRGWWLAVAAIWLVAFVIDYAQH